MKFDEIEQAFAQRLGALIGQNGQLEQKFVAEESHGSIWFHARG